MKQLGSSTGNGHPMSSKSVSIHPNQASASHLNSSVGVGNSNLGSSISTTGTGKVSALARSRVTLGPGDMSMGAGMLGAPDRPINVDSTSFEEWMKMATDNVSTGSMIQGRSTWWS